MNWRLLSTEKKLDYLYKMVKRLLYGSGSGGGGGTTTINDAIAENNSVIKGNPIFFEGDYFNSLDGATMIVGTQDYLGRQRPGIYFNMDTGDKLGIATNQTSGSNYELILYGTNDTAISLSENNGLKAFQYFEPQTNFDFVQKQYVDGLITSSEYKEIQTAFLFGNYDIDFQTSGDIIGNLFAPSSITFSNIPVPSGSAVAYKEFTIYITSGSANTLTFPTEIKPLPDNDPLATVSTDASIIDVRIWSQGGNLSGNLQNNHIYKIVMKKLIFIVFAFLAIQFTAAQSSPWILRGGAVIGNYSSDPVGIGKGQIYYNTTDSLYREFNGTEWKFLQNRTIPLAGTEVGKPITGELEWLTDESFDATLLGGTGFFTSKYYTKINSKEYKQGVFSEFFQNDSVYSSNYEWKLNFVGLDLSIETVEDTIGGSTPSTQPYPDAFYGINGFGVGNIYPNGLDVDWSVGASSESFEVEYEGQQLDSPANEEPLIFRLGRSGDARINLPRGMRLRLGSNGTIPLPTPNQVLTMIDTLGTVEFRNSGSQTIQEVLTEGNIISLGTVLEWGVINPTEERIIAYSFSSLGETAYGIARADSMSSPSLQTTKALQLEEDYAALTFYKGTTTQTANNSIKVKEDGIEISGNSDIRGLYGFQDYSANILNDRLSYPQLGLVEDLIAASSTGSLTLGFFGQSNMDCVIEGADDGGDKTVNPNVTVWDDIAGQWIVADLDLYPFGERDSFFNNVIVGTTTGNNNIAFHTAKRIQEKTKRPVRIIFDAEGGVPIERWIATDPTPTRWTSITSKLTASGVTKLDGVFFYQGESNSTEIGSVYGAKVQTLRQQFEDIGVADREMPFIQSEMSPFFGNLNGNFFTYPEYLNVIDDKYYSVIEAKDLTYFDNDNVHLTGISIVTASDRFASEFLALPKSRETVVLGEGYQKTAAVWEEQANGVNGGASVVGIQTRVLTDFYDPSGVIINNFGSNQFVLRAGTYKVNGYTNSVGSDQSKGFLKNVTDGTMAVVGSSNFINTVADGVSNRIDGFFTITAPKFFEIQLYVAGALATNGLGVATTDGQPERYTYLEITKIK